MPWKPSPDKGYTIPVSSATLERLYLVLDLIEELKSDDELDRADWGGEMVRAGAELIRNGKYLNYTWSVSQKENREVRICYSQAWDKKKLLFEAVTIREWFKTREKGED